MMRNRIEKRMEFLKELRDATPKKPLKNRKIEIFGEIFLQTLINCLGWDVLKVHLENDYGIDDFVQVCGANEIGHEIFGIQVKSGKSYYNKKENYFFFPNSKRNLSTLRYWESLKFPVFILFYYREKNLYSFIEIHNWLRKPERWKDDRGLPVISRITYSEKDLGNDTEMIRAQFKQVIDYNSSTYDKGKVYRMIEENLISEEINSLEILFLLQNSSLRYSTFLFELIKKILNQDQIEKLVLELVIITISDWVEIYRYFHGERREDFVDSALEIVRNLNEFQWVNLFKINEALNFSYDYVAHHIILIVHSLLIHDNNINQVLEKWKKIIETQDFSLNVRIFVLTLYLYCTNIQIKTDLINSLIYSSEPDILLELEELLTMDESLQIEDLLDRYYNSIPTKEDIENYMKKTGLYSIPNEQFYKLNLLNKESPNNLNIDTSKANRIRILHFEYNIEEVILINVIEQDINLLSIKKSKSILDLFVSDNKYHLTSIPLKYKTTIKSYTNWDRLIDKPNFLNFNKFHSDYGIEHEKLLELNLSLIQDKIDIVRVLNIDNNYYIIPDFRKLKRSE